VRLLDAIIPSRPVERMNLPEAYFGAGDGLGGFTTFSVGGQTYTVPVSTTMPGQKAESIANSFEGFCLGGLMGNSVIFGLASVRLRVFSEARFTYQRMTKGRPGDLWGDRSLRLLETPWPGGVTGDLLAVMLLHADFAGNAYVAEVNGQLVCMRPDWVDIVLAARHFTDSGGHSGTLGMEKVGYAYYEGGKRLGTKPMNFLADEVAHFSPMPDPLANYRGMSWLTPIIREIRADNAGMDHKLAFFGNSMAQPLDAKIATPTGWTTMGEVRVGSSVMGPDGRPRKVMGVYPQGEKDVYRLTFGGGAVTECCEDHVWTVTNFSNRPYYGESGRTFNMTLRQILDSGVHYPSGAAKWSIPVTDPVEFDIGDPLPLDPYLLGSLLGDGSFRGNGAGGGGISMSSHAADADEQVEMLTPLLPDGVMVSRRQRGGWEEFYFSSGMHGPLSVNPMTTLIKSLGLFNIIGHEKFIPATYLTASVKDRVALLQGLIDTDGNTSSARGAIFANTSQALVRQLKELVESLGGTASMTKIKSQSTRHRSQWVLYISNLPEWIIPCRLARKVNAWNPAPRRCYRTLRKVELVRRAEVQCIKVDSEDGLYLTDDFIVTHNTPNLAVSLKEITDTVQFNRFVDAIEKQHRGAENAGRTLYLGAGADVTVVGSNLKDMDFATVTSRGETRLALAAGVPPTVACLSEGMQGSSLNAGNFGQSRRQFADMTMSPLWRNAAGSLAVLVSPPDPGSRLWYDARDVPFLREDQGDLAGIQQQKATAIRELFMAGFTPESIVAAVTSDDLTMLVHTGSYSVQTQTPGVTSTKMPSTVDYPPEDPEGQAHAAGQVPAAGLPAPKVPAGAGNGNS